MPGNVQFVIKCMNKEFKLLDADTSIQELILEFCICFIYGLLANTIAIFMMQRREEFILLNLIAYYTLVSVIINRKYETMLGKFILFPLASTIGAYIGYKLTNL